MVDATEGFANSHVTRIQNDMQDLVVFKMTLGLNLSCITL